MAKKKARKKSAARRQTRVMLVDDDRIARTLFATLIEQDNSDLHVAHTATRIEDAKSILAKDSVDVVILDLSYTAQMSGLVYGPKLRAAAPEAAILVVTQYEGLMDQCRTWADGYLVKDESPEKLLPGIRDAIQTRAARIKTPVALDATALLALLTEPEREVLIHTANGLNAMQVAEETGKRKATVDNLIKIIYGKFDWPRERRTKVELARFARQAGLITD